MKNYRNNNKRNRYRNNGSNFSRNINGHKFDQNFSNSSDFQRKYVGKNSHSIQKLIEKYIDLGKEAISKGDKILSENYFQHADHFLRVINERNSENQENNLSVEDRSSVSSDSKTNY
jgi:hypothetical protein